jgi:hypothetical protein
MIKQLLFINVITMKSSRKITDIVYSVISEINKNIEEHKNIEKSKF